MFLLIHIAGSGYKPEQTKFTFHYVSTYTTEKKYMMQGVHNLHSTMFLLILTLLDTFLQIMTNLHSTMFLLIPALHRERIISFFIYIPLCFYLYPGSGCTPGFNRAFTFHYVSTYTSSANKIVSLSKLFTFHYVSTYTQ